MSSWAHMIRTSLDSFVQQKVFSPAYVCTHPVHLLVCSFFLISRVCPPMFKTVILRCLWSNFLLFGIFRLNYAYIASCHRHENKSFITVNRYFMNYKTLELFIGRKNPEPHGTVRTLSYMNQHYLELFKLQS